MAPPRVAVVGGGLGGRMATLKLAEAGVAVDLFSIVPVKRSHSVCAQGGINGAVNVKGENDSPEIHFTDTCRGGDFLARWGNAQNHHAGTEQDRRLFHPHDAHWIPYGLPGYGNVLLFNNGPHPVRGRSSEVLEIRLDGESETSRGPVWSCTELGGVPFFSSLLSGAQRLPNGNTLVSARVVRCSVVNAAQIGVNPSAAQSGPIATRVRLSRLSRLRCFIGIH